MKNHIFKVAGQVAGQGGFGGGLMDPSVKRACMYSCKLTPLAKEYYRTLLHFQRN